MKWKTKDGHLLDIRDMSTGHIINCIRLMDRKGGYEITPDCAFDISDYFYEYVPYSSTSIYKEMLKELTLRK